MSCIRITLHRKDWMKDAVIAWVRAAEHSELHDKCSLVLHSNELIYYQRLSTQRRKMSFLLGRYAAKQAISTLLHMYEPQYAKIEIIPGIFQQPIVKFQTPEPVGISISHTNEYACAIAFPIIHPMAIDVERVDILNLEAIKSQILPQELHAEALCQLSELTKCTIIWTAKEALSKVLKCGMMSPFSIFETVNLSEQGSWYVGHFPNFGQYKFHAWVLEDHVISIALPKRTTIELDLSSLLRNW
jgi:4'-phosphopantetheinyl transferase